MTEQTSATQRYRGLVEYYMRKAAKHDEDAAHCRERAAIYQGMADRHVAPVDGESLDK